MLFLDLDLDRDCFSDSLGSSSYFDLWILREGQHLKTPAICRGWDSLPAVADHAHAPGFGFAVVLGALLEVLLTPDALRIAEARLGHRINVAPGCKHDQYMTREGAAVSILLTRSNLETFQGERLILLNAPPIHMAHAELVDAQC